MNGQIAEAWQAGLAALLDPGSSLRRSFADLPRAARLSPSGLDVALRCLARGVRPEVFAALQDRPTAPAGGHDVVILAGNLPALFLQPLARSLAARRSVLLKPASEDCGLALAFVKDLTERLPGLSSRVSCRHWRGGDRAVEDGLFAAADRVIAYGNSPALTDLARRVGAKLIRHGPKTSLCLAIGAPDPALADQVARDVAMFDQRGCLSVSMVFSPRSSIDAWSRALHDALRRIAVALPPGEPSPGEALAAHQARAEAAMRGAKVLELEAAAHGAVLVEPSLAVHPTPALRTVQLVAFEDPGQLAAGRGGWQGLSLAGPIADGLRDAVVEATGVSRVAPAGQLQDADATWEDGEE